MRRAVDGFALGGLKAEASGSYARLRRGLVDRLLDPQGSLLEDLRLLLIEGFRPDRLQQLYFDRYRRSLIDANPDLDSEDSFRLASRYVSPPALAPHVRGAAIDLTLADASGREADMGTAMNATPEDSVGACYFAAENISKQARRHREILAASLSKVGLVNYPTEWWHWSFGETGTGPSSQTNQLPSMARSVALDVCGWRHDIGLPCHPTLRKASGKSGSSRVDGLNGVGRHPV